MLRIKRVPTVVSNYQKEEGDEGAPRIGGCGRNCLNKCCVPGICSNASVESVGLFFVFYPLICCGS